VATTRVDHDVHPAQVVPGLNQFMNDARKIGPEFVKALRQANSNIAVYVVQRATAAASTQAERQVARGFRAKKNDLIPKIDVSPTKLFTSSRRPNARRSQDARVRIIDVFFGTEFGGGKYTNAGNDTHRIAHKGRLVRKGGGYTTQFRAHQGTHGYFFYPTVRKEGPNIVKKYAETIDDVRKQWERGQL